MQDWCGGTLHAAGRSEEIVYADAEDGLMLEEIVMRPTRE